ncbi:hypothetical protein [Kibdelosporangium aridum]|uniref:hypothetical protein n=1 Tax=Kibdelosporangium aridum TaxID=2030 RepID=UPI0035ECB2E0
MSRGEEFLFQAGPVAGAQDASFEDGVAQGEERGLDFPAFVIELGQLVSGVAVVVEQGGDQAVAVAGPGARRCRSWSPRLR